MKLTIFGATGRTGRHLVAQAAAMGYEVRACGRRFEGRDPALRGVTQLQGDVNDPGHVRAAVVDTDAVISVLGTGRTPSPADQTTVSEGTRAIVAAMTEHGPKRLVCTSGFGIGDSVEQPGALVRRLILPLYRHRWLEMSRMEEHVTGSALEWTIVRATHLTGGRRRGKWRVVIGAQRLRDPSLSRADLAAFLLEEMVQCRYLRKAPTVVY